jgi:putative transposase
MNSSTSYRSYPEIVKDEVARSGNVYLFPDLKIPRTTAQYWVKRQKFSNPPNVIQIESVYKRKSEFLAEELAKEKALRELLETVRKVFPYDFRQKQLKNKLSRAQIVTAIRECIKYHKLAHCLDAIGLSKSAYLRWCSEIAACKKTNSLCERRKATQLTSEELATMKKFVTSKKFAHISVSSLHLLAQRTGELFCSVDTWYKYLRAWEWKRPWTKETKNVVKTGIRAKTPNEIWHLDVTVVNIRPGVKLYIQAVIDNFSRFVLAWRVTDEINAKNTVESLRLAAQKAKDLLSENSSTNVMMDPGTENRNASVLRFISSRNLVRVLARVDIHYSNSMIERLFHSLKNNFLYHQGINTIEDLTRKADFYFKQHNYVIPLAAHRGGRPAEVFVSSWNEAELNELHAKKALALVARKTKNLEPACNACPL